MQSPSEQWCVPTQPQRCAAPPPICSQIPNAVVSQPCELSLQACRVGAMVGGIDGDTVGEAVRQSGRPLASRTTSLMAAEI